VLHWTRTAFSLTIFVAVAVAAASPPLFGTADFIEYWSANRLFLSGMDPYNPDGLLGLQRTVLTAAGVAIERPLMMWNPPWLLLLLAPVLSLDFQPAAKLFLGLNVILLGGVVIWTLVLRKTADAPVIVAASALMLPFWSTLRLGQISICILALAAGVIELRRREYPTAAGILLGLLSIKPHLALIFVLFILVDSIRRREFAVLRGAVISGGVLILLGLTVLRESTGQWLTAVQSAPESLPLVVAPTQWKTATLAFLARDSVEELTHLSAAQFLFMFPVVGMLLLLALDLRFFRSLPAADRAIIALAFSVVFSPFGWIFDAALLAPFVYMALAVGSTTERSVILGLNGFILAFGTWVATEHHQLAFAPAALLFCSLVIVLRALRAPADLAA